MDGQDAFFLSCRFKPPIHRPIKNELKRNGLSFWSFCSQLMCDHEDDSSPLHEQYMTIDHMNTRARKTSEGNFNRQEGRERKNLLCFSPFSHQMTKPSDMNMIIRDYPFPEEPVEKKGTSAPTRNQISCHLDSRRKSDQDKIVPCCTHI